MQAVDIGSRLPDSRNMKDTAPLTVFRSVMTLKCPACRKETMFKKRGLFVYRHPLDMHEHCRNCGQKYEIEPGFWLGALWVSYPIVVLIEIPFLFTAIASEGISVELTFGLMIVAFAIFFPLMVRLGRSIWAHVFIKYRGGEV